MPLIIACLLLLGCRQASDEAQQNQLRGVVINLSTASFSRLATIDVRADDGSVTTFRVEGDVGLTPSHTREHMVLVEPVTVTYRNTPDGPVALRVDD